MSPAFMHEFQLAMAAGLAITITIFAALTLLETWRLRKARKSQAANTPTDSPRWTEQRRFFAGMLCDRCARRATEACITDRFAGCKQHFEEHTRTDCTVTGDSPDFCLHPNSECDHPARCGCTCPDCDKAYTAWRESYYR